MNDDDFFVYEPSRTLTKEEYSIANNVVCSLYDVEKNKDKRTLLKTIYMLGYTDGFNAGQEESEEY